MIAGVGFNDQFAPWGTKWFGKGAANGGWYNNFRVPFQKSIRVTGKLPANVPGTRTIWVIMRGSENLPTIINGFQLPSHTRLILQKIENKIYEPLAFVPVANIANGEGLLLSHTLAIASDNPFFLEGCYHAYTEYNQTFPGLAVSTGTEDYFDSAFYFNADQYYFDIAGFTHNQLYDNGSVELSAYRMHDLDPIFFTNGFRFDWRNGDVLDDHGLKCVLETGGHVIGPPANSTVTSYTWIYIW